MSKELFQIKEQKNRYRIICEKKDAEFIKINIQALGYTIIYQYNKITDSLNSTTTFTNFIIDAKHIVSGRDIDKLQKFCNYKIVLFENYFKEFN